MIRVKEKKHHQKHSNPSHRNGIPASEAKYYQHVRTVTAPTNHNPDPAPAPSLPPPGNGPWLSTLQRSEFSTGPSFLGIKSFRIPGNSISSAKSQAQFLPCCRGWDFIPGVLASTVMD